MKNKALLILSAILFALFVGFSFCVTKIDVKTVDVLPVEGVEAEAATADIAFASINVPVRDALGFSEILYKVTSLMGYAAIALCMVFAVVGLCQWIIRKSLKKVDSEIILLGVVFVIAIVFYIAFEVITLNFRPWILDAEEGLEASYPSSHTLLSLVGFLCTARLLKTYLPKTLAVIGKIGLIALAVALPVLRLLSGAHWLTDIIAAVLLGLSIVALYYGLVGKSCKKVAANEN